MRHGLHFPRDYEALKNLVHKATAGVDCVVMQTGHFLLKYDDTAGKIIPCIDEELEDPRHSALRRDYGQFPILTWKLGLQLLGSLPAREKYVMAVVNDWQYLPPHVDRRDFYDKNLTLPASYERELNRYGSAISVLKPKSLSGDAGTKAAFFSEATLRNHYRKTVKRLIKKGELPPDASVLQDGDILSCRLIDSSGAKREIYCSELSTDCAGETAQFLAEAAEATECGTFINLFPSVCWNFVEYGTELANKLFRPVIRNYLNVGLPSTEVSTEEGLLSECKCSLHRS